MPLASASYALNCLGLINTQLNEVPGRAACGSACPLHSGCSPPPPPQPPGGRGGSGRAAPCLLYAAQVQSCSLHSLPCFLSISPDLSRPLCGILSNPHCLCRLILLTYFCTSLAHAPCKRKGEQLAGSHAVHVLAHSAFFSFMPGASAN